MGKVFTPEELEKGFVPTEGAHLAAAQYIVEQLFYEQEAFRFDPSMYVETGLDSGLVHGSVTHETSNRRSDVDLVILYRPRRETLETIKNVFDATRRAYKVPIEANLITVNDALAGNHGIDPLFFRYLCTAQENSKFSWNWPMETISLGLRKYPYGAKSLGRIVQKYVGFKAANFSKELVSESIDSHRIQRAYELPKNLGRKVLSMLSEDFKVEEYSGEEIIDGFLSFVERQANGAEYVSERILSSVNRLVSSDIEYAELLEDTAKGKVPIREYRDWFYGSEPRSSISTALSLCHDMSEVMSAYMRGFESVSKTVFDQDSLTEEVESENFNY